MCLPIIYVTNLAKASSLIQPSANYTRDQTTSIKNQHPTRTVQLCPDDTPYLAAVNNTRVCVGCPSGQYFSAFAEKCLAGCPSGTIYNSTAQMCEAGIFLTDPEAANLISPLSKYAQWKEEVLALKNKSAHSQYCPKDTPFESQGKCTACSGSTPYFNIDDYTCVGCGTGRWYSGDERKCVTSFSGGVSLERMIANIL